MNITRSLYPALVAVAVLHPVGASAQCEDAEAAAKTAASVKAEMSDLQAAQRKAFVDTQVAVSNKAIELSWTVDKKNAFLKTVSQSPQFVLIDAKKQQEVRTVEGIQQELTRPDIRDDPVKACTVGLRLVPAMRRVAELNNQENQLVLERIAAAK